MRCSYVLQIGSGLKQRDYHAASKPTDKPAPLNIPRPKNVQSAPKTSNSWDDPVADDFNVFSVYSRRQQERRKLHDAVHTVIQYF